jgi:membrane protein required for colicin V production
MNYLDVIFIIIILFFSFNGLRKGLVKVVGGIVGIFVGIYFAGLFYLQFSEWLQTVTQIFGSQESNIISFIVVFIIANRLFAFIIFLLDKIVSIPIINPINKALGGFLGFLQGALIVTLTVTIFTNLGSFVGADNVISNSLLAPYSEKAITIMRPFLPQDLKSIPSKFFDGSLPQIPKVEVPEVDLENMSIDELIDYLNSDNKIQKSVIDRIKENALKEAKENSTDYIINQFKQYLDKVDSI